jgi:hypothetical protein
MRTRGLTVLLVLVLGVAGCGGSQVAATPKLPGLDAACGVSNPRVRPAQINFCGDGGFFITRMKWSAWNAVRATGKGTAHLNDCNPYCARGHFHAFAVSVGIAHPKGCPHRTRAFTQLSVVRGLAGKGPLGTPSTYVFGCP